MDKALSDSDIAPYVNHVVKYSDLQHISARQLLRMIPVAILYQEQPNRGHWTLLLQTPEGVEFFDSYGMQPDTEFKELSWQQPHYLAQRLLQISNLVPINYNQYQLQSRKEGINTCGRWVILRSLLDKFTTSQFQRAVTKLAKHYHITPDQLVTDVIKSH